MKVTVITAVLNSANTIEDCIKSVAHQTYPNIEHIIIDGGSTDGTRDIIERYRGSIAKVISEPDNGMYDAINKGLKLSEGEVVAILNSDDFYAHDGVLEKVSGVMNQSNTESCYGDLLYVDKDNSDKVIRYWKSGEYKEGSFRYGWHPPHPAFFVRKRVYERFGYFNTDFKIASDYELIVRFLERYRISTVYIPEVLVKMRVGGKSNRSLRNILIQSWEDYRAWRINGLRGGFSAVLLKKLQKAPQFIFKP